VTLLFSACSDDGAALAAATRQRQRLRQQQLQRLYVVRSVCGRKGAMAQRHRGGENFRKFIFVKIDGQHRGYSFSYHSERLAAASAFSDSIQLSASALRQLQHMRSGLRTLPQAMQP
jgi:hypothetical protein